MSFGLGIGPHSNWTLLDGKYSCIVGDIVVAQHTERTERGADRVACNRLARCAAVGRRHTIGGQETSERTAQCWIGITVGLAGCNGCPGRVTFVDGEVCAVVGDVVVVENTCGRIQRRADVVGTARHRFAWGAAVACRYCIGETTATACGQRDGIGITVGLAGCNGCPGRVTFVDGEVCAVVGDVVVVENTCGRIQCRADVVGTACHRFAWGAAVACRYCIGETTATACGQRDGIGITVGLAGCNGCPGRVTFVDGEVCAVVGDVVVV